MSEKAKNFCKNFPFTVPFICDIILGVRTSPACSCSDFICAKAHGKFEAAREPKNAQSVFLGFDANINGSDAYNSYMHIIWID